MINDQNKKKIGLIIADPNEIHNLNEFIYVKTFEHKNFKVDLYECNNNYIYVINSLIGIVFLFFCEFYPFINIKFSCF